MSSPPPRVSPSLSMSRNEISPHSTASPQPVAMATSGVRWSCEECKSQLRKKRWMHERCGTMTTYLCVGSGQQGLYTNYTRHQATCAYCSDDGGDAMEAQKEAEKESRFVQWEVDEKGRLLAPHRTAVDLLCEMS